MRVEARRYGGTRDILPEAAAVRKEIVRIIAETFERFGFGPLETPALEYATTLEGKYGPEAERLIYKFDQHRDPAKALALRYDFTVPLARVIAMNPELQRGIFRRYQIGPIWRRDRPQKNRYREFVQCDVDIIGVESVTADAEIIACLTACLENLRLAELRTRLNNRKILNGLAQAIGAGELAEEMMRSLDKLDKIGQQGVQAELQEKGFTDTQVTRIFEIGGLRGSNEEKLAAAEALIGSVSVAHEGIAELRLMLECLAAMGVPDERVVVDLSLARGLEIYTGPVYEIEVPGLQTPSIAGGGRYDRLIGIFLDRDIPATGASFGLDRVANAMQELDILPSPKGRCQVLVTIFDESTRLASLSAAAELWRAGINTEIFQGHGALREQFGYADRRGIPFAIVIGPDEQAKGTVTIRDLHSRTQNTVPLGQMIAHLNSLLEKPGTI
ncbi:MAG: histidine--tRNA ligase [Candidatus Zipacnadales bacterium]